MVLKFLVHLQMFLQIQIKPLTLSYTYSSSILLFGPDKYILFCLSTFICLVNQATILGSAKLSLTLLSLIPSLHFEPLYIEYHLNTSQSGKIFIYLFFPLLSVTLKTLFYLILHLFDLSALLERCLFRAGPVCLIVSLPGFSIVSNRISAR